MPGLVPGTHVFRATRKTWVAGRTAMMNWVIPLIGTRLDTRTCSTPKKPDFASRRSRPLSAEIRRQPLPGADGLRVGLLETATQ
jgi:hypothetical protein